MNRKRVSKKQKRVRATNKKTAETVSEHLVLGDRHDRDREAAAKIRAFPSVPKRTQVPFPHERVVGFVGHWIDGVFCIQEGTTFVKMNVERKQDAWYLRQDPRPNRQPRKENSGLVETNVAVSSGFAYVMSVLAREKRFGEVRQLSLSAHSAGMQKLKELTGYEECYGAAHPDAEDTFSFHFGLWPIDLEKRCLIGRSVGGKRGRKGLRLLGDAFMSVLRHHEAIGLPEHLTWLPLKNLKERTPDDWAVGLAMDSVLRDEILKLPDGNDLLRRADQYQKKAARDWLARYESGAAGVAKLKDELDSALQRNERRKKASERLARIKENKLKVAQKKNDLDQSRIKDLEKEIEKTLTIFADESGDSLSDAAFKVRKQMYGMYEEEAKAAEEAKEQIEELKKVITGLETGARENQRMLTDALAAANQQVAEKTERVEVLEGDLMASQGKVGELEKEIGLLRQIMEILTRFLGMVMKNGTKLGTESLAMLHELGGLVGVDFQLKTEKEKVEPENNIE